MIFKNGYPSVITGEFAYFQAIEMLGVQGAHRQLLYELRDWLELNPPRPASPLVIAQEAYQIHRSFTNLLFRDQKESPIVGLLDDMYVQIFGRSGRVVAHGELPLTRRDCYGARYYERAHAVPMG